jgi:endonuclease YncB( thermonuclease family)
MVLDDQYAAAHCYTLISIGSVAAKTGQAKADAYRSPCLTSNSRAENSAGFATAGVARDIRLLLLALWPVVGRVVNYPARVFGISDGDTLIVLKLDMARMKIRLNGVDALETGQEFGGPGETCGLRADPRPGCDRATDGHGPLRAHGD